MNKSSKNLSKILSGILSMAILAQCPANVAKADGSFVEKHPILTTVATTALVSVPLFLYVVAKDNKHADQERQLRLRVNELESDCLRLRGRVNKLEIDSIVLSGHVDSLEKDRVIGLAESFRALQNRVDDLSNLVDRSGRFPMDLHSLESIRRRLDQLEHADGSREETLNAILQQIAQLSAITRRAEGSVEDPVLRQRLAEIHANLALINERLGIHIARTYQIAHELSPKANCQLSAEHGQVYVGNIVSSTEVNKPNGDFDTVDLGQKLYELCALFDVTAGVECPDNEDGWRANPYEYFLGGYRDENSRTVLNAKFRELGESKKLRLAQMITVMYNHKDEPNWRSAIGDTLTSMAAHGGHCSMRAEALIDDGYALLTNAIKTNNLDGSGGVAGASEMDILFSALKEQVLSEARAAYLADHANQYEPLVGFDRVVEFMEYMLGMRIREPWVGILGNAREEAGALLTRCTSKREIIRLSHRLVMDRTHGSTEMTNALFHDVNEMEMSVSEYCNIIGKTRGEINIMINAIEACGDDELKAWANSERKLRFNDIVDKIAANIDDYDGSGCSEINNWLGLRFLIKCFNEHYLENRE